MTNFDKVRSIKESIEENVIKINGVNAVGIGKNDNGESAIFFYVESQAIINKLMQSESLQTLRENVSYKFIIEAPLKEDILYINKEDIFDADMGRYRPLIGGIQLYLMNGNVAWMGTLGAFVKSKEVSDKNLYMLSNLHVFSSKGLAVLQPLYGTENLVGCVSMAKEFENTDAALAMVNNPSEVKINVIEEIGTITETKSITENDIGKKVLKRGRTTGLTEGTLESVFSNVRVSESKVYKDCAIVRAKETELFSNSGDSGSPVTLRDEKKLIGLHFGGNQTKGGIAAFCKINNVFQNLNVKLPE